MGASKARRPARLMILWFLFQVWNLSLSQEQAQNELKEKEEQNQELKDGLRVAMKEMSQLEVLLKVVSPAGHTQDYSLRPSCLTCL